MGVIGEAGEGYIRIGLLADESVLEEAMQRIASLEVGNIDVHLEVIIARIESS